MPITCKGRATIDILPQGDILIERGMTLFSVREPVKNAHSGFLLRGGE